MIKSDTDTTIKTETATNVTETSVPKEVTSEIQIKVEPAQDGNQQQVDSVVTGSEVKSESQLNGEPAEDVDDEDDEWAYEMFGCKFRLNMGRPARAEEIANAEEVSLLS